MPFQSKAQMRKFLELVHKGEMKREKFDEWVKSTPDIDALPERLETNIYASHLSKIKTIRRVREIK